MQTFPYCTYKQTVLPTGGGKKGSVQFYITFRLIFCVLYVNPPIVWPIMHRIFLIHPSMLYIIFFIPSQRNPKIGLKHHPNTDSRRGIFFARIFFFCLWCVVIIGSTSRSTWNFRARWIAPGKLYFFSLWVCVCMQRGRNVWGRVC